MGQLTTHVLDLATGRPAAGLAIELFFLDGDLPGAPIRQVATNDDGRVSGPILEGAAMQAGRYELLFHAGDYLRGRGEILTEPAFLDLIPIRFAISDPAGHYHVPLLLSPYGYSTYRGS